MNPTLALAIFALAAALAGCAPATGGGALTATEPAAIPPTGGISAAATPEPPLKRSCAEYEAEALQAYAAYYAEMENLYAIEPRIAGSGNFRQALEREIAALIPHETHTHEYGNDGGNLVPERVDVLRYLTISESEREAYHQCPQGHSPHTHP